jgi:transposase
MSGTKRKIFGTEYKAKVGLEAIQGVKTVNRIAQGYGVHWTRVGQWKKDILEHAGSLFEGKRGPKAVNEYSKPEQLYGEIGKLKMELDWLKKSPGWAITNHLATVLGLPGQMASSFISRE